MDPAPAFEWHDHHFINGIVCLDFANTVVYRPLPKRREDRLGSLVNLHSWFAAAGLGDDGADDLKAAIALREAIDTLFRNTVAAKALPAGIWEDFIARYAGLAGDRPLLPTAQGLEPASATTAPLFAIAHSALTLALSSTCCRVKICGGCGWLFVDRTRNAKKRWCISSMCGSRDKARRYYARKAQRLATRPAEETG